MKMIWSFDPPSNGCGDDIATLTVEASTNLGPLVINDSASNVRLIDGDDDELQSVNLNGEEILGTVMNGCEVDLPDFGLTGSTSKTAIERFQNGMMLNGHRILKEWALKLGIIVEEAGHE